MLLVEDNFTDHVLTEYMLISELGVLKTNIGHISSGLVAIEKLCPPKGTPAITFDLVILDFKLNCPTVNGVTIANQL